MRAPRALIITCVAALVAVASACAWWVTDTARSSIRAQFVAREATAATERASQVSDAVAVARDRLRSLTALPGVTNAVQRLDREFLQPAVVAGTRGSTIVALAITTPDGVVLAHAPADQPPVLVGEGETRLEPAGRDATVGLSAPIPGPNGSVIGTFHEKLRLSQLVPRFDDPIAGDKATTTLVAGGATTRTGRISASAAVPGHPWTVVITAPATAADEPAAALGRKLLAGFALTFVIGAALLAAIAGLTLRSRRRLEADHQQAVRDAATDSLTGAGNRRAFDERLAAVRGMTTPVGVVIVDLDDLKTINDTRGHAAGDAAICAVADAIRASVRGGDEVYRFGGDEFVVVLEGAGVPDADRLAQRIVDSVEQTGYLHVSVGAAIGAGAEVDETLRHADARMYEAKRVRAGLT